jgi:hypothetical protein
VITKAKVYHTLRILSNVEGGGGGLVERNLWPTRNGTTDSDTASVNIRLAQNVSTLYAFLPLVATGGAVAHTD